MKTILPAYRLINRSNTRFFTALTAVLFSIGVFACSFSKLYAQPRQTISGYIQDIDTKENLARATVIDTLSGRGVAGNAIGYYELSLTEGPVVLRFSYVGYQNRIIALNLSRDTTLNVQLTPSAQLEELVVTAEGESQIATQTQMSAISIPVKQISEMPMVGGEADILKIIQLLPGVQAGNEGSSGIYVRGGGAEQNLMLLDDVPLYNVSHLFGFFSVFNSDMVKNLEILKGGFPARYGGRLSSVVDVEMKEGNKRDLEGSGSVGLISSKITAEGPLIKNKTSFILSGRRTYADLLARPFLNRNNTEDDETKDILYFFDANAKIDHTFNPKNRLTLSFYTSRDQFGEEEFNRSRLSERTIEENTDFGIQWGTTSAFMRWTSIWSKRVLSKLMVSSTRYYFEASNVTERTELVPRGIDQLKFFSLKEEVSSSEVSNVTTNLDFDVLISDKNSLKFGGLFSFQHFKPESQFSSQQSNVRITDPGIAQRPSGNFNATELDLYLEDELNITKRLKGNFGFRYSMFKNDGTSYTSNEPRVSLRYLFDSNLALKASYSFMKQYVHLLSNTGTSIPTDLWVPATSRISPQKSNQLGLGIAKSLFNQTLDFSIEGYYKDFEGLIEYSDDVLISLKLDDFQDQVETGGIGESYGGELFLQKRKGETQGWLAYTLSWTNRKFENLNGGEPFPFKFDRRHNLSLYLAHELNKSIFLTMNFVFSTGSVITTPKQKIQNAQTGLSFLDKSPNNDVLFFSGRNNFRLPPTHRLDLGVNFRKSRPFGERLLSISIYNAYNNRNPFFVFFKREADGERTPTQVSILPIIPSFNYTLTFN